MINIQAQGTIAFNNKSVGIIVTHVYGPEPSNPYGIIRGNSSDETPSGTTVYTGAALAGTGYTAQLWAAPTPGGGQPESTLLPVTAATTTFRTGSNAGYIQSISPDPAIPGVAAGQIATLQLRAWDNGNGSITTYGAATLKGASPVFNSLPLGGGTTLSPNLVGLQSFNLPGIVTPEPGTIILGLIGAAALFFCRKKL